VRVRAADLRAGVGIERWSIAWMSVEGALALAAALMAGSVVLLAFGADSLIELVSAFVLLRRLRAEQGGASAERLERRAGTAVGVLLLALAVWVVATSARDLMAGARPDSSLLGLAVAAASVAIMPWIIAKKRRLAAAIGSAALRADAACGLACVYMAGTALGGLLLRAAFGWWWADPVAALGLVYFLLREGREALAAGRGEACGCGCGCEPGCTCPCCVPA